MNWIELVRVSNHSDGPGCGQSPWELHTSETAWGEGKSQNRSLDIYMMSSCLSYKYTTLLLFFSVFAFCFAVSLNLEQLKYQQL